MISGEDRGPVRVGDEVCGLRPVAHVKTNKHHPRSAPNMDCKSSSGLG